MTTPFSLHKTYSFNVYPVSLLGDDFKNVTVLSVLGYQTARMFADVDAIHANVYPYLPAGSPSDPSTIDYVQLKTASGEQVILGIPWINEDTIELKESGRMSVLIEDVGSVDVARVRAALAQNGYKIVKIELVS